MARNIYTTFPITRATQVAGRFYLLVDDNSVVVISHDGEGRHFYDNMVEAVDDHGEPDVIVHIYADQLRD
jgi:hypothetical protein